MKDANGAPTEEKEHPSADTASEKHDAGSATKETSSSIPAAPKDEETAKSKSTPEPVVDEKMDVDTAEPAANTPSKDEPASATEDAKATQSTEATQDTETAQDETATDPPAVSPKSSAQLPDKEPSPTSKPENEQARDSRAGSPAKVSRTREDDNSDEPASKRVKIGDSAVPAADSLVVANGPSPAPQDATASADESVPDDKPIAPYQNKLIRAHLASLKKTKNGQHFRQSVEKMWPILWPDYRQKVHEPIDLSMLEAKFREDAYKTYGEFKAKVQLLYNNALAFNGPEHAITASAAIVRDQILAKLPELDKMEEPVKPEKGKTQPTRHTEPRSATQARRQSQPQTSQAAATPKPKPKPETVSVTAPAAPPTPSSTAPTFALPPNGIPQIRRDSTREDGDRPKRPIHPPKNRDLDYNSKVNRKKKLDPEQRFHDEVLNKIKKGTYFHMNQWFMEPVDPVALNIPTYFSVVKKPMDLSTMTRKNLDGHYKSTKDLEKDMRLIVHNAEQFNGPDHEVTVLGKSLEELFKEELAKKDEWMSQHYPQDEPAPASASAASPERSAPETEEESEAEGGDDTNDAIRNLQHRLNEEQGKLNSWLNSKKPDPVMIEVQQQMVQMIQKKLVEEKNKFHGEAKKPKPKKKNPKSKPKPSSSATASSATKKSAPSHAAATTKKSSAGSSKKAGPKKRTIGQLEKAVIEEGISTLDGNTLTKAVEIIKKDTGQNVSWDTLPANLPRMCLLDLPEQWLTCLRRKTTTAKWSWTSSLSAQTRSEGSTTLFIKRILTSAALSRNGRSSPSKQICRHQRSRRRNQQPLLSPRRTSL